MQKYCHVCYVFLAKQQTLINIWFLVVQESYSRSRVLNKSSLAKHTLCGLLNSITPTSNPTTSEAKLWVIAFWNKITIICEPGTYASWERLSVSLDKILCFPNQQYTCDGEDTLLTHSLCTRDFEGISCVPEFRWNGYRAGQRCELVPLRSTGLERLVQTVFANFSPACFLAPTRRARAFKHTWDCAESQTLSHNASLTQYFKCLQKQIKWVSYLPT